MSGGQGGEVRQGRVDSLENSLGSQVVPWTQLRANSGHSSGHNSTGIASCQHRSCYNAARRINVIKRPTYGNDRQIHGSFPVSLFFLECNCGFLGRIEDFWVESETIRCYFPGFLFVP